MLNDKSDKINLNYRRYIKKKRYIILLITVLSIVTAFYALCSGSSGLGLGEVLRCIIGQGDRMSNSIVLKIRLPRVITAIIVGILLAISGSVMQSVLRNPLASASTLGISQGASFGATIGIICFGAGVQGTVTSASAITIYNPTVVVICAFVGGIVSAAIILLLSKYKQMKPSTMVLVGVALSSLFNGGTTLVQYFADDVQVAAVVFWTFGDLGRTS